MTDIQKAPNPLDAPKPVVPEGPSDSEMLDWVINKVLCDQNDVTGVMALGFALAAGMDGREAIKRSMALLSGTQSVSENPHA